MIVYTPFSAWWCCLNPRERNTLISLNVLWFTAPTYVERTTFDVLVAATGEGASMNMLAWFMLFYGLEYQLIPCGEDCLIDAVVFTGGFWFDLYAFSLTAQYVCSVPCTILTFPL